MTERWEYLMLIWSYVAEKLPGPVDEPKWGFRKDLCTSGAREPRRVSTCPSTTPRKR
jgi:hypothetical protein